MERFDLTQPMTSGMPVYPGDPQVDFRPALNLAADGATVTQLSLSSHTGTHLDAPAHVMAGGKTVDQLDVSLLDGDAYILSLARPAYTALAGHCVSLEDLEDLPERLPLIVCIATGWDAHFHDEQREQHPYLGLDLVAALWQRGARVLGVDTLSPDPTVAGPPGYGIPVHEFWLGNDGVIVENLRGLTALPTRVAMTLLPLPLVGLDGSPVRAIARTG